MSAMRLTKMADLEVVPARRRPTAEPRRMPQLRITCVWARSACAHSCVQRAARPSLGAAGTEGRARPAGGARRAAAGSGRRGPGFGPGGPTLLTEDRQKTEARL